MTRTHALLLVLLIGATPLSAATPVVAAPSPLFGAALIPVMDDQRRERGGGEDRRGEQRGQAPSMSAGDAARRVSSGREGRMLGIRPAGDGYVVRWEYPGGRVADIRVDGSGRVSGGR